ncbi:hypothetical protein LWI29_001504 [Acer saccharum]|uniref:S-protein homolog n=1 Tax=Acer saccharum TaxID=4024 RepID=A0AA39T085_ACESA|nr:hypothetical protein LWI29_001504 [Acer saccharum]
MGIDLHLTSKHTIVIKNSFKLNAKSLYIHCRSKDNNIGQHWLAVGQTIAWSFHRHELSKSKTVFHCYAQWGNKIKRFNAYEFDSTTKHRRYDEGRVTWFLGENGLRAVETVPKDNKEWELTKLNWD